MKATCRSLHFKLHSVFAICLCATSLLVTSHAQAADPLTRIYHCAVTTWDNEPFKFTLPGLVSWGAKTVSQIASQAIPGIQVSCT